MPVGIGRFYWNIVQRYYRVRAGLAREEVLTLGEKFAVALLAQAFPNLSGAQIVDILFNSADDLGIARAEQPYIPASVAKKRVQVAMMVGRSFPEVAAAICSTVVLRSRAISSAT